MQKKVSKLIEKINKLGELLDKTIEKEARKKILIKQNALLREVKFILSEEQITEDIESLKESDDT